MYFLANILCAILLTQTALVTKTITVTTQEFVIESAVDLHMIKFATIITSYFLMLIIPVYNLVSRCIVLYISISLVIMLITNVCFMLFKHWCGCMVVWQVIPAPFSCSWRVSAGMVVCRMVSILRCSPQGCGVRVGAAHTCCSVV